MGNIVCGLFMAAAAVLLFLRLSSRIARIAWLVLLTASLGFALFLTLSAHNLININVGHYYLGAKYDFPYSKCYVLINAALELPQVEIRDLDRQELMLRGDDQDQRAYYLDLLREAGVQFDPLSPTGVLRDGAIKSGAVRRESQRILSSYLPADQIESFRTDVQIADRSFGWSQKMTTDYGYNGSPWYGLIRHLDPTLYIPFGEATGVFNLILQLVSVFLLVWFVGSSLGLALESKLAAAALIFSSWDFVGYALQGLIFAGMWIPIALAAYYARRQKGLETGISIAWAGLIKLFPFILAMPIVGLVVKARGVEYVAIRRWCLKAMAGVVLGTVAFFLISMLGGRSWDDFFTKIYHQFQTSSFLLNSVSLSRFLMALGITDTVVPLIGSLFVLSVIGVIMLASDSSTAMERLPRRMMVLLSVVGLMMRTTWFSYYMIAPLLLFPLLAKQHRAGTALAALSLAFSQLLPDFDDPSLMASDLLHVLKLLPYILIPMWFLWLELRDVELSRPIRKTLAVAGVLVLVLIGADIWRMAEVRSADRAGGKYLDAGDGESAAREYQRLCSLDPGNAIAALNQGIALAVAGRTKEAGEFMAKAGEMAPDSAVCHANYGLLLLQTGDYAGAGAQLDRALEVSPNGVEYLFNRARVFAFAGNTPRALAMLERAQELAPGRPEISLLIRQLTGTNLEK
ncbi:MAG: tetratricopeptide repeat protein [Candidatus Zixiibacteriota bacterium]